jgi:hypothetical protein
MADYLPKTDGGLRDWTRNFSNLITANPSTYGLMASDAAAIAGVVDAYAEALTRATDPTTKTQGAVAAKDSAKAAMVAVVRRYAQVIKMNDGVTNEEKIDLGLNIDDTQPSPVPAPTTQPICSIVGATPLQHTLRFADSATPTKRAKPEGVVGLELYYFIGENPPVSPDAPTPAGTSTKFYGLATREPFAVKLNAADVGQMITYYCRWVTRTGRTGPWSTPVAMTVAARSEEQEAGSKKDSCCPASDFKLLTSCF